MSANKSLSHQIIAALNNSYGCGFFAFSEKGLTIKLVGELKAFFDEYDVKCGLEFWENFHYFRDDILIKLGLDDADFVFGNELLYPNGFGLSNCPLWGFGGSLMLDDMPVEYAFAYFNNYQIFDWVEVLIEQGEVVFETFIDNSEQAEKARREIV